MMEWVCFFDVGVSLSGSAECGSCGNPWLWVERNSYL